MTKSELLEKVDQEKSTLLDILMGLLPAEKGEILIDGKSIKINLSGWQKNIGCVPQDVFILDDSLKKNIAFGLDENDIDTEKQSQSSFGVRLNQLCKIICHQGLKQW